MVRDPASLYRAFEQVKDGRKAKGKRYPLPLLLTVLLLGKLAGEKSINGIVDWVKERKSLLKQQLNWPKGFPVNSTCSPGPWLTVTGKRSPKPSHRCSSKREQKSSAAVSQLACWRMGRARTS